MAFFAVLLIGALERRKRTVAQLEQTMDDLNAVHGRLAEQASLLDKAQDAIVVCDLEHRITYWNKSAERLYGWTAAEVLGKVARDLQSDAAEFDDAWRMVLEQGDWMGELRQTGKDGQSLTVESRWTLVRGRRRTAVRRAHHQHRRHRADEAASSSSCARSAWRASARWPAASRTTSTTSSRRSWSRSGC